TSNDAGLSVPDWPTSFHTFAMPRMVGGVFYEHGHRLIAGATIVLTLGVAIWTWLVERRRWMKRLALAAFATILVQAVLGGITVLNLLPPAVSTAHAAVGQTFFCIAVIIAVFTGQAHRRAAKRGVGFASSKPCHPHSALSFRSVCAADSWSDVSPQGHGLVAPCS